MTTTRRPAARPGGRVRGWDGGPPGSGPRPPHLPPLRARPHRSGDPRRRLVALLVVLALAFVAVFARLVWLQALTPHNYASIGEAQRVRTVQLPGERGSIFDRNGHELAMSIRQKTVWADPRLVTDPIAEAEVLAPVLGVDEAVLRARLRQSGAFVYLARQVPDEVAARVEALGLDGIGLLDEPRRFTPAGSLAASVLGTVDIDNNGLSGIERQFDDLLRGRPGELLLERGPDGRTIAAGERRVTPAARGADVVLTLDRALQYEAERALAEQVAATGADGGIAIVMEPATGDVLALANIEAGSEGEPPRPARQNLGVTTVFEPGSVNKLITLAGALEDGVVRPDDVLTVPDRLRVSVHEFKDHDPHPTLPMTVTDVLRTSSNVGTIMIAQELGKERMDAYLRAFGFGSMTGLGFPDESPGLLLDIDDWTGTSIGSIPIGQGVAVTALQMLLAFNVVANGGEFVAPRLVRSLVDAGGDDRAVEPAARRRVVSPETARAMTEMLASVVHSGTGTRARIDGYNVAGKTGTALKPSKTSRGYEPGAYVASFAGFVPAENPQLSAIVVLDEPRTSYYAGLVSAPVFADIAQYALRHLRVPPPSAVADGVDPITTPTTLVDGGRAVD